MNNKESNNANRQSNPIVSSGFIIFVIAALLIDGAVLFFTSQDGEADDYTEEISEYISNTEVQDEIEEDVPTDVVEEKTYDEAFYTITPNGVANIFIGNTFNDYNTSLMKEEDIAKQWFDFSLVDIKDDNSYDMQTYYMFMKIYEENKGLLCMVDISMNDRTRYKQRLKVLWSLPYNLNCPMEFIQECPPKNLLKTMELPYSFMRMKEESILILSHLKYLTM